MLSSFLPLSHIRRLAKADNWQQAVMLCAEPLLAENLIESRYVESIFQTYEKTGPYFVIAPQIAMPHSRPEDGVNAQALSLLVLNEGVDFGSENDPVRFILMLAATDSHSHLAMLAEIAELLGDDKAVNKILNAESETAIFNLISHYPPSQGV